LGSAVRDYQFYRFLLFFCRRAKQTLEETYSFSRINRCNVSVCSRKFAQKTSCHSACCGKAFYQSPPQFSAAEKSSALYVLQQQGTCSGHRRRWGKDKHTSAGADSGLEWRGTCRRPSLVGPEKMLTGRVDLRESYRFRRANPKTARFPIPSTFTYLGFLPNTFFNIFCFSNRKPIRAYVILQSG